MPMLMTELDMDLTQAPLDVMTMVLQHLCLKDRFTCALVCKAWAEAAAAAAATHSIILESEPEDLSCLQTWLGKHGDNVKVLQVHGWDGAVLTALPCAHLQDLLLHDGSSDRMRIGSKVVADIAAATKITSVSLSLVSTPSQHADVVSALTALPDLQQLTWRNVSCSGQYQLRDSALLQHLTMLTRLELREHIEAEALQHLGALTKLQHLNIDVARAWAAAGYPGLQELKALTTLQLDDAEDIPVCAQQLTALQQLDVSVATPTAVNGLQGLTRLTHLRVRMLKGLTPETAPLQLPALQHLELCCWNQTVPMPFLASCNQLCVLKLSAMHSKGAGSMVASTMLQHLKLSGFSISAADGAASPGALLATPTEHTFSSVPDYFVPLPPFATA